ncbi:D-alanyl-D-alanine carboxypeptidase [Piscinibacter sp. Jin2]|uniref:D-alanyl-D-alanine carboxypeptidase n=1 Tax=Aquariibacter lacus TaxID=2801332 RepID=A0A9X0XDC5_9BURK|nr:D-alanyl-D-alanine carboxypeptidase [Piscinibacter lacus]
MPVSVLRLARVLSGWRRGRPGRLLGRWPAAFSALLPVLGTALLIGPGPAEALPAEVRQALRAAGLPPEALAVEVRPLTQAEAPARLAWRETESLNPASLIKLFTTGVALEQLGPSWTWRTPVARTGRLDAEGVLHGDLVIQGRGDPSLVLERVWLLLRELRERGLREIRGDLLLDRRAFALPPHDPAAFDGEALRPYNVGPDALLLNQQVLRLRLVPEPEAGRVRISREPPDETAPGADFLPLAAPGTPCGDWRAALTPRLQPGQPLRLAGRYPAACGERIWAFADSDPARYAARLLPLLWAELGGRLHGRVREAPAPAEARWWFSFESQPLAHVVRDINKFSNNPMARQLALTLALEVGAPPRGPAEGPEPDPLALPPPATPEAARRLIEAWVRERSAGACPAEALRVDNGAGLSREGRSSMRCLAGWIAALWSGPAMPELLASLPVAGLDGTARRRDRDWGPARGRAWLKTGSLRDSLGLAGVVQGRSGQRYAFAALLNHADAGKGRPVLDALVRWTAEDAPETAARPAAPAREAAR